MREEFWRLPRVMEATGMRRSWIYQAMQTGDFPTSVKLSRRAVGWRRSEIETWMRSRVTRETKDEG